MKLEVEIQKKYAFMIFGAILILAGAITIYAYNESTPNVVGHHANDIQYSGGLLKDYLDDVGARLGDLETFSSGNLVLASSAVKANTTSTSWTKLKEIIVGHGGTLKTSFDLRNTAGQGTIQGRIYVNGNAVGTAQSRGSNTNWATYTEDITVQAGDKVQLYGKGYYGGGFSVSSAEVRNFELSIGNGYPGAFVTLD